MDGQIEVPLSIGPAVDITNKKIIDARVALIGNSVSSRKTA
ncbi:MAG: hypothetical protein PHY93_03040 [Bacteriovorax sp.]|nr:hypothetical protein [Bacteriovorax sp.]